jgi:signal transduction histidine kinase
MGVHSQTREHGVMPDPALAAPAPASSPSHPLLRRPLDRGLLGGVCAGLAEYLGVEVLLVRFMVAASAVAGGIGVALYALAWALIAPAPGSKRADRPRGAWREAAAIVVAVAVLLFVLRRNGLWLGDRVVWPLILGSCGMALVWRPISAFGVDEPPGARPTLRSMSERLRYARRTDGPRLVVGAMLVALASAALLHATGALHSLGDAIGAVAVVAAALGLLVGPWVVRLGHSLSLERAARIREQERAEVAAHLHDSVLQTLALIQKRAGDPREVAGLARRQERELRRWLFERRGSTAAGDSIKAVLEAAAAEVEEMHGVPIEAVVVGDGPLDVRAEAVVLAAREAMSNAAKFAACERVDLYAEIQPSRVGVFVRDRGLGFDLDSVPDDRRGVRDSIVGRMERHGGQAAVRSAPGEGTEVELVVEREPA